MSLEQFELHNLTNKSSFLFKSAEAVFESSNNIFIKGLSEKIPSCLIQNEKINIVFVGQYSAGKSSLIKALTGNENIKISASITTEKTEFYDWNDIIICDTPGIHTGIRPDHDEIAYDAISKANLVVFVVTNELFDPQLILNFKKLAVDLGKSHEMMLVINKMGRHEKGNTKEAQEIVLNEINRMIAPILPEDLYISFLNIESIFEAEKENDDEIKQYLIKESGFDSFIKNLNMFVKDKKLISLYTNSLYKLQKLLETAMEAIPSDDTDVDATISTYQKKKNILIDFERNVKNKSKNEIIKIVLEVKKIGRKFANELTTNTDQDIFNKELSESNNIINNEMENLSQSIQNIINQEYNEYDVRLNEILELEITKKLSDSVSLRFPNISPEFLDKAGKIGSGARKFGEFLLKNAYNGKVGLFGKWALKDCAGTNIHNAVKQVGTFFGHKFKPWEAVKMAKIIGKFGKILNIAGGFLSVVLTWYEENQEKEQLAEIKKAKEEIRSYYDDLGKEIEMHYDKQVNAFISSSITPNINDLNKQINALRDIQNIANETYNKLVILNKKTLEIINEFHSLEN